MRWKQVGLLAAIGCFVLTSTGCFLRILLGGSVIEDIGDRVDQIFNVIRTEASTSVCRPGLENPSIVECDYFVEGDLLTSTASLISELGVFGVFVDPLVLELPAGVTDLTATFVDDNDPTNSGDLVVYRGLNFVPVDDTRTLSPAPGSQLVIVDLPPGAPVDGVDYSFSLSYRENVPTGAGSTPIKALATGKAVAPNGKTFYPPMLPCTSDLSSVPTLQLPETATLELIALPGGIMGCNGEFYTFFSSEGAPLGCDLDNDNDVDRNDIREVLAFRNQATDPGDPRDRNGDGVVNGIDARLCVLQCTLPRCAVL